MISWCLAIPMISWFPDGSHDLMMLSWVNYMFRNDHLWFLSFLFIALPTAILFVFFISQ